MDDPNFPANLDISPLPLTIDPSQPRAHGSCSAHQPNNAPDQWGQRDAIRKYGIAGRVWEATVPLIDYLTPGAAYDPPCPVYGPGPRRIIELGSGQSLPSLHMASHLDEDDTVILTDLPQVIELCQQSIDSWRKTHENGGRVTAQPLAWGEDSSHLRKYGPFTHILMCDLVYFPHLYPPLLRTLLELTEPETIPEEETFGPVVILSYKSRTLSLEESFFDVFGQYFKMDPVIGGQWDAKMFICRRWKTTEEWSLPNVKDVMTARKGIVRGRDYGLVDQLYGSLEWEV